MPKTLAATLFATLALVVTLQLYALLASPNTPAPEITSRFADFLPDASAQDVTDPAQARVLHSDQFFHTLYWRDSVPIELSVAYWEPRKVPFYLADFHVPEVCWIKSGWSLLSKTTDPNLAGASSTHFTKGNLHRYALTWHWIGPHPHTYPFPDDAKGFSNTLKRISLIFKGSISYGLKATAQPQFLVRLSAPIPLDEILSDQELALFKTRVNALATKSS